MNELLKWVTDPYDRKARLWPALLALFPLIAMLELLYAPRLSILSNVVLLAGSCGGLYLLTDVSRQLGKRLESDLYNSWGGRPSAQLLRHRDTTIDPVTKHRYHAFLSGKINHPFPNFEREASNPQEADDIYDSAVRWLLNLTRDKKRFSLLFYENIAYGFRRNALGLKPVAIMCSLVSVGWVMIAHGLITNSSTAFIDPAVLTNLPEPAIISLVVSVGMMVLWLLYFTGRNVRNAAFTYAETLLRACDLLDSK